MQFDLSRFPRRRYTQGFTPLEHMPNFTTALRATCPDGAGPNVWIKRDDMPGLSPGSNNFLFRLLGVEAITVVPAGTHMLAAMHQVADEVAKLGRKSYIVEPRRPVD